MLWLIGLKANCIKAKSDFRSLIQNYKIVVVWPPANLTGYAISVRKVRALKIGLCPIINDRLRRSLGLVRHFILCWAIKMNSPLMFTLCLK